MALLKSNQPAGSQKIFTKEKTADRDYERMVNEKANREMNPKYSE